MKIEDLPISSHKNWIKHKIKDSEKRKVAEKAHAQYEYLKNKNDFSLTDLQPIIDGINNKFSAVSDISAEMLMDLAEYSRVAQDAVVDLLNSTRANVRFIPVAYLRTSLPRPLCNKVITIGLNDRSVKVRAEACKNCEILNLKELLPLLKQRVLTENHHDVKEEMKYSIALLEHGYYFRYENGEPKLTIRDEDGFYPVRITQEDIDKKGIQSIVAQEKAKRLQK